jgi:uroporphyrinogen decarboxylase
MSHYDNPFSTQVTPDWESLKACVMRQGTPHRVHHIELFLDQEIKNEIINRYHICSDLDPRSAFYPYECEIRLQRFLGFDYVRQGIDAIDIQLNRIVTYDTAELQRQGGRSYIDEKKGPITNWAEFELYPWPESSQVTTEALEWYEKHLPDDMCVIGSGGFGHFAEYLTWLMGYETLCFALYDQRDLVQAIADRLMDLYVFVLNRILEFDRVKIIWGSDDMGFKTGPMIGPDDLRHFVLPGHKKMAEMSHQAHRPYLLHSCGNLSTIMDDLLDTVKIDAKHSFEDTIEDVRDVKTTYGTRIALLGGIDVDFLCRADTETIRQRVKNTLDICMPGGGYCLGTGNSVANYIPLHNYLTMVDEGRNYHT